MHGPRRRAFGAISAVFAMVVGGSVAPIPLVGSLRQPALAERTDALPRPRAVPSSVENDAVERPTAAYFTRTALEQAATDRAWRLASTGTMRLDKVTYRSRGLDIPAFVFQPLGPRQPKSRPVMVWVHENIRGHFYAHYIPFVREAVTRGYIVIAPEYRGSIGYGRAFYDAIDYGGAEVDDVSAAIGALAPRFPEIDPQRAGIVGWSHGGLIALLAVTRNQTAFDAAAAIVPVSNLIQRLAIKGDRLRQLIDPHNRFGGPPARRMEVYKERSPYFQIDRLQIPLLVHVAENDDDVTIDESRPFVEQLRIRKPELVDIKVYGRPFAGHLFDRQVDADSLQPLNTPDQADSWTRVWQFFGRHLGPGSGVVGSARADTAR